MKHTKIILAGILALTLTACSDTNTAEGNYFALGNNKQSLFS